MPGVLPAHTCIQFAIAGVHRSWPLDAHSAILALHFYVCCTWRASKPCTRRNHTSTSASSLDGCYPQKSGYCPRGCVSQAFNCRQIRYNPKTYSCRRRLSTGYSQACGPGTRPGTHRMSCEPVGSAWSGRLQSIAPAPRVGWCLALLIKKWRPELSSCLEVGLVALTGMGSEASSAA